MSLIWREFGENMERRQARKINSCKSVQLNLDISKYPFISNIKDAVFLYI